ncbi:MAG: PEP-utilizing enzyme [Pseudobdellovibrionaceae bacterium]
MLTSKDPKPGATSFQFGTKAETLSLLSTQLSHGKILPQVRFTVDQWKLNSKSILVDIQASLSQESPFLIVRSSCHTEDQTNESSAGKFLSLAKIPSTNGEALIQAIDKVLLSFGKYTQTTDQIFVQPYLDLVDCSGVLFSRDLDTLAPYFILNYDDETRQTGTVTSGCTNQLKTQILFRRHAEELAGPFKKLIRTAFEIEKIVGIDYLDIEFAIHNEVVYILQVRPIVRGQRRVPLVGELDRYLEKIDKKLDHFFKPQIGLAGSTTVLGVMPDWNPAEMIGIKPRPLALSLYQELITDHIWADQRCHYGYQDVRSVPLMVSLLGLPYIDARASFNSLLPNDISEPLKEKLCQFAIHQLALKPEMHDKIEFELCFSSYCMAFDQKAKKLLEHGFSTSEIAELKASLLRLTEKVILDPEVFWKDIQNLETQTQLYKETVSSNSHALEKIHGLVQVCKRYGTAPFAGVARAGFMAMQMMRSFVCRGFITENDYDIFMESLDTISREMNRDKNALSKNKFLEKYGHLRPGTYDVLSKRYDEAFHVYFSDTDENSSSFTKSETDLSAILMKIQNALKQDPLNVGAEELLHFIRESIKGREYAKLLFTRGVSEILRVVTDLTSAYGFSREEASYLRIPTLLSLYSNLDHRDLYDILREEIERNRRHYEITSLIRLPQVIAKKESIYSFLLEAGSPNYITLLRTHGEVVCESAFQNTSLNGKIVCIQSADPGYDWIFTHGISGLITAYGGANSHMAIRAAEMKIPAVIGAGEKNFREWSSHSLLEIDAGNRFVRVLR